MASSCPSGNQIAYAIDLDIVKLQSPSSRSSHSSSSPPSTLSEFRKSPLLAISTKKARTPRKRPNQAYTEAAALLAKLYPTVFSTKNLRKHRKFTKPYHAFIDTSELLPIFPCLSDTGFLIHQQAVLPEKSITQFESKSIPTSSNWRPREMMGHQDEMNSSLDYDTKSILDEEVGEGIDSIMGNSRCPGEEHQHPPYYSELVNPHLGHSAGRIQANMTRALRHVGNGDWWCSPTVEMRNIVPNLNTPSSSEKKKKKLEKPVSSTEYSSTTTAAANSNTKGEAEESSSSSTAAQKRLRPTLRLNLNYDRVIDEWSVRRSPYSEEADPWESPADIIAKLSDIDLRSEVATSGGAREAGVVRYKEKTSGSRFFSKKVSYQARKVDRGRCPRTRASGGRRFAKTDGEES